MCLVTLVKTVFVHVLFIVHAVLCMIRAFDVIPEQPLMWILVIPLVLILLEMILIIRDKGKSTEHRWFAFSVFFYLCSSLPTIWMLESDRLTRHRNQLTGTEPDPSSENATQVGISALEELSIPTPQLSPDTWVEFLEQSLLFVLVVGRWLLPRGNLTHDELSTLLFVFIGIASDITEILELFDQPQVLGDVYFEQIILGVWSASLLQFTLVLSSTGMGKHFCCRMEVWGILTSVVLQDIPFLTLRLYAMIVYNVTSINIGFYTFKNILVIVVQFYRLGVILCPCDKTVEEIKDIELSPGPPQTESDEQFHHVSQEMISGM